MKLKLLTNNKVSKVASLKAESNTRDLDEEEMANLVGFFALLIKIDQRLKRENKLKNHESPK